jgi:hypothetical protein
VGFSLVVLLAESHCPQADGRDIEIAVADATVIHEDKLPEIDGAAILRARGTIGRIFLRGMFMRKMDGKCDFRKVHYEPEFKGGNYAIEDCARR